MERWTRSLGLLGVLLGMASGTAAARTTVHIDKQVRDRDAVVVRTMLGLKRACRDGGVVTGDLVVQGRRIHDTAALRCVRRVGGDLVIRHTGAARIEGLERLEAVGGDLRIEGNAALRTLGPWPALQEVGGDLAIEGAPRLEAGPEAPALSHIGGELRVHAPAVASLGGLGALSSVGALWLEAEELGDLRFLARIDAVPGDVRLGHTHRLRSLAGLEALRAVGGDLEIASHRALSDLGALSTLERVGGRLSVGNSPALRRLDGFGRLGSVGALDLVLPPAVEDLGRLGPIHAATRDAHLDAPGLRAAPRSPGGVSLVAR
jgi:hypothetical protein